jgi:hypothetical protein
MLRNLPGPNFVGKKICLRGLAEPAEEAGLTVGQRRILSVSRMRPTAKIFGRLGYIDREKTTENSDLERPAGNIP